MASSAVPRAKIGILSIGDMGVGLAKLLVAKGYAVATNCHGRSEYTIERAKAANVELLASDDELVQQSAVILSVVPPGDATKTAQRVLDAVSHARSLGDSSRPSPAAPLYFADLNAVSPATCRAIAALFAKSPVAASSIRFVDGAILGGPPARKDAGDAGTNGSINARDLDVEWARPGIPVSSPHQLSDIPGFGAHLFETLNMKRVGDDVGAASGLKMCFASTSKGFIAIATQALTTAHRLGVLDPLREEMQARLPNHWRMLERSVVTMPPKAYRWVFEMEEIGRTHEEDGGFDGEAIFSKGAAGVYRTIAADEVLGKERIGKRVRGTTVEDLASALTEGLERKRKKTE